MLPVRRIVQGLVICVTLTLPFAAVATPVTLTVQSGSVPGFGFSWLHSADNPGCQMNGFWMCGSTITAITGSLTANRTGLAFSNIAGSVMINAASHAVTGSLDFGVAQGASLGTISIASFGTFDFVNTIHSGPANSYVGNTIALWGQNFAPTTSTPPAGSYGVDLGFKVSPAIPEPSAALVFALGALWVRRATRRSR